MYIIVKQGLCTIWVSNYIFCRSDDTNTTLTLPITQFRELEFGQWLPFPTNWNRLSMGAMGHKVVALTGKKEKSTSSARTQVKTRFTTATVTLHRVT